MYGWVNLRSHLVVPFNQNQSYVCEAEVHVFIYGHTWS